MTIDTKIAVEIIKPIADELCIEVHADDKILYVDDIGIGISGNSTYATLMEFIGYLALEKYNRKFRTFSEKNVKRYWLTSEQLSKLGIDNNAE